MDSKKSVGKTGWILSLGILAVCVVGWYVWQSRYASYHQASKTPTGEVAAVKKTTVDPKTSVVEVTDAEGKSVKSPDRSFTLTVPQHWFYDTTKDKSNPSLVNVAPSKELLDGGVINFYVLPDQCISGLPTQGSQSQSFSYKSTALNGAQGFIIEEMDGVSSSTPNQKYVDYKLCRDNKGYFAHYVQKPQEPDHAAEFDELVLSWKF